jgi:HEPN domain-containing protein
MGKRFEDWLRQAEKDLLHAKKSLEMQDYEWSCFSAQQSAEKALKALYDFLAGEAWGHSVTKLLKELPFKVDIDLINKGIYLDKMYIPARYPNGFETGAPCDYFNDKDAKEAICYAEDIFSFVKTKIRQ